MNISILNETFVITSTSYDFNNETFVASFEAINNLPFYGV